MYPSDVICSVSATIVSDINKVITDDKWPVIWFKFTDNIYNISARHNWIQYCFIIAVMIRNYDIIQSNLFPPYCKLVIAWVHQMLIHSNWPMEIQDWAEPISPQTKPGLPNSKSNLTSWAVPYNVTLPYYSSFANFFHLKIKVQGYKIFLLLVFQGI